MRRGAILLEVILSVALFTMGALAILSQMSQGARALEQTQRTRQAADLAATAMARIEARLAAPESLTGPAERWDEEQRQSVEDGLGGAASLESLSVDDFGASASGWELAVETEPAPFDGLTLVSVTATFADPARVAAPGASYTLRQLVRLGTGPRDEIGADGALIEAQERGARQQRRPSSFGGSEAGESGEQGGGP